MYTKLGFVYMSRQWVTRSANSHSRSAIAGSEASALRPMSVGMPRRCRIASGPV